MTKKTDTDYSCRAWLAVLRGLIGEGLPTRRFEL